MFRKRIPLAFFVIIVVSLCSHAHAQEKLKGISKEQLLELYSKQEMRTYRIKDNKQWLTFNHRIAGQLITTITFFLEDDTVMRWKVGDRAEVVREYLSEFCSQAFIHKYKQVYQGIVHVLKKIPNDVFLALTDRSRPVVFSEVHAAGLGRLANSSDIRVLPDDPPTFSQGVWLIKLSTELNEADSVEQIAGVVAHELAHRILEHGIAEEYDELLERKANALLFEWGFKKEFQAAKDKFGAYHMQSAPAGQALAQ